MKGLSKGTADDSQFASKVKKANLQHGTLPLHTIVSFVHLNFTCQHLLMIVVFAAYLLNEN